MLSILNNKTFNCFYSLVRKFVLVLAVLFFPSINLAYAEDSLPDTFSISIGGYSVYRYDGTMSLTDPDLGAGISISPEDTLGLDNEQTVLRLSGYYRFTKEHSLSYSWYRISSDGFKSVEEEFDWVDENNDPITIPVGAKVTSSLDYNIFKVGYLWSFYHSNKVEMSTGAGLHMTRIAVDLHADTTSSDIDAQNTSVSVPLPVISFALNYAVTPRFSWAFKGEAFSLRFEDWDGIYTDMTLSMEYRAFRNVGLGIGLGTNSLKVTEDTRDHKFIYDNRISGILFYTAAYF